MATYATNLSVFDAADAATNWSELSGHTSGGAPAATTENFWQNSTAVDQATGQATGTSAGMECDYGSTLTWTTSSNWVFLIWQKFDAGTNIQTWASGGTRVGVGSSSGNMNFYNALGDDFGTYPSGGWQNTAIDPEYATADATDGSPTAGSYRLIGSLPNMRAKITKGSPHVCDVIRYGRGDFEVTGTAATFSGMASWDNEATRRWGLFYPQSGSYLWKGLMSLGLSGTSVTFSDSNKTIRVADTPRVLAGFNKIEVRNTGSSVTWDTIQWQGVGTSITGSAPVSPGDFEVVDNATIDFDACSFTDMGTFTFNDGTNANNIDDTIFRRCGLITTGGATFTGCQFDDTTDTVKAVTASSPANAAKITASTFTSGGTGHGLEITGTAANITLTDLDFVGYDTADPGTAANKAIYVNIASGSMTINISGGSGVTQDHHVRTAGCTVTVSADTTVTFRNLRANTEVRVYKVSDDSAVDGIENATTVDPDYTGRYKWSFAAPASTEVYYMIINKTYKVIRNESYSVPASNADLVVFQEYDRNYSNP